MSREKSQYPWIDKLRIKVDNGKTISIKEACFIIWAELLECSSVWKDFQDWCKEQSIYRKRFTWLVWKGIFSSYKQFSKSRLDAKYEALCKCRSL